jgi:hypothetical protein
MPEENKIGQSVPSQGTSVSEPVPTPPPDLGNQPVAPEHPQFLGTHELTPLEASDPEVVSTVKTLGQTITVKTQEQIITVKTLGQTILDDRVPEVDKRKAAKKAHESLDPNAPFDPHHRYTDDDKKVYKNLEDKLFRRKFGPARALQASEHTKAGEEWSSSTKLDGLLKTAQKNFSSLKARVMTTHDTNPIKGSVVVPEEVFTEEYKEYKENLKQKRATNPTSESIVVPKEKFTEDFKKFKDDYKINKGDVTLGLAENELQLLKNIFDAELYLTHATQQDLQANVQVQVGAKFGEVILGPDKKPAPLLDNAGNTIKKDALALSSRKKLVAESKLPAQASDNTQQTDLEAFATDDYTFFSLEAGDRLQKVSSRFGNGAGGRVYRFKLDDEVPLNGGVLLTHDIVYGPKTIYSADQLFDLPGIKGDPKLVATLPSLDPDAYAYPADKLKLTLGLLVVEKIRKLSPEQQSKIHALSQSASGMNSILNGLFRAQILIPEYFSASKFKVTELNVPRNLPDIKDGLQKAKTDLLAGVVASQPNAATQYQEAVDTFYVQIKERIPPDSTSTVSTPPPFNQDDEREVILELENHLTAIPVRDVEMLWVNYIKRFMSDNPPAVSGIYFREVEFNRVEWFRNQVLSQSRLDPALKEEILYACFGSFPKPAELLIDLQKLSTKSSPQEIAKLINQIEDRVFEYNKFPPFDGVVELGLLREIEKHQSVIGTRKVYDVWRTYLERAFEQQGKSTFIAQSAELEEQIKTSSLPKVEKTALSHFIKAKLLPTHI